jgi:hypothetical protein
MCFLLAVAAQPSSFSFSTLRNVVDAPVLAHDFYFVVRSEAYQPLITTEICHVLKRGRLGDIYKLRGRLISQTLQYFVDVAGFNIVPVVVHTSRSEENPFKQAAEKQSPVPKPTKRTRIPLLTAATVSPYFLHPFH